MRNNSSIKKKWNNPLRGQNQRNKQEPNHRTLVSVDSRFCDCGGEFQLVYGNVMSFKTQHHNAGIRNYYMVCRGCGHKATCENDIVGSNKSEWSKEDEEE